jgi:hypothetical protein
MLTVSAPETLQLNVEATPVLTAAGLAEKEVITGSVCGNVVVEGVLDDDPGLCGMVTVMHPDSAARTDKQIRSAISRERLFMLASSNDK